MVKRAIEMEGTVTGEHGVGLTKRDYLSQELGQTTVDAMRKVSLSIFYIVPVLPHGTSYYIHTCSWVADVRDVMNS